MMNWKKHIKIKPLISLVFLVAIYSCEEKAPEVTYVARVNNEFLTDAQLNVLIDDESNSGKFESEIIKEWVNTRIFLNKAEEEGIFSSAEYKLYESEIKSRLAFGLYFKEYLNKEFSAPDESETQLFFIENKNDFQIQRKAYILNYAKFSDEMDANSFRNNALSSGWNSAVDSFSGSESLVKIHEAEMFYYNDLNPSNLYLLLDKMNISEISIIVPEEQNNFVIVQLIEKLKKGSIPEFSYVKDKVAGLLTAKKQKQLYRNLINKLYLEADVEIFGKEK